MKVIRANRAEDLVPPLAELLVSRRVDPLAREVVVVTGRGMDRWLSMRLAEQLGACANVHFPSARAVVAEVLPGGEAWEREPLGWAIAAVLPELLDRAEFAPVRDYLRDGRPRRALQLATRVAGLFDRYLRHRPEWVRAWEDGEGEGWQPALWRALRERLGPGHARDRLDALTGANLPERIAVFGAPTLDRFDLDVLGALDRHTRVDLFVAGLPSSDHPLARALGPRGRAFWEGLGAPVDDRSRAPGEATRLAALQSDLLRGAPRTRPHLADASIEVHACHGAVRQVEVLRERILALLAERPGLQPRDIRVVTPDLDAWAPLVHAVFGAPPHPGGPPALPFRIADRGIRHENPVAAGLVAVLGLAGSRVPASAVLDLFACVPFAARFGLSPEEVETACGWVRAAGARWAVDAAHREAEGQPAEGAFTWRFALDRLLLGQAMAGDDAHLFRGVLPLDEIEGASAPVAGRFADACETLFSALDALGAPRTLPEWRDHLTGLLDTLFRVDEREKWRAAQVRAVLGALVPRGVAYPHPLDLDAVRGLLYAAFEGSAPGDALFSGAVTFAALMPGRAIPAPVVCVLGLDDGAFPKGQEELAFDLLAADRRPGDPDRGADDRQALLDTLLSARDALILTYAGRGARDNARLPPAVPLGELLDCLAATFPGFAEREHPLQPFSPHNFVGAGASFDGAFLSGARRLLAERDAPPPFVHGPLPIPPDEDPRGPTVRLDDLAAFLMNPSKDLLARRLRTSLEADADTVLDREPAALDQLQQHTLGTSLVTRALAGRGLDDALPLFHAAGRLPLGAPGRAVYRAAAGRAKAIAKQAAALRDGERRAPLDVEIELGGARLVGRLPGGWSAGGLVYQQYGKLHARQLLAFWARHLVACLADDGFAGTTNVVWRNGDDASVATFGRVADARARLEELVALHRVGRTAPVLLFPEASRGWEKALREGKDPVAGARAAWNAGLFPECDDAYVHRLHGDAEPFDPAFALPGHAAPPGGTFADIAERVWAPLTSHLSEA